MVPKYTIHRNSREFIVIVIVVYVSMKCQCGLIMLKLWCISMVMGCQFFHEDYSTDCCLLFFVKQEKQILILYFPYSLFSVCICSLCSSLYCCWSYFSPWNRHVFSFFIFLREILEVNRTSLMTWIFRDFRAVFSVNAADQTEMWLDSLRASKPCTSLTESPYVECVMVWKWFCLIEDVRWDCLTYLNMLTIYVMMLSCFIWNTAACNVLMLMGVNVK